MHLLFKNMLDSKRSLRFANFIMFILAGIAVLGTFPDSSIPFLSSPHSIYHRAIFLFLLGFLTLLTFVATLQIAFVVFRFYQKDPNLSLAEKYPATYQREFFVISRQISDLKTTVIHYLRNRGVRIFSKGGNSSIFVLNGFKHRLGIWGSFLLHFGFLIVVLGGFLTFRFADIREVTILEGEAIILPDTRAKVALEKFTITLQSGKRTVEEYNSRLLVQNRKGEIFHYDLKVNHPLNIEGTKVFQTRYHVDVQDIELTIYQNGKPLERIKLKVGGKQWLSDAPFAIEATRVVPDFVMDDKGKVVSRSPYFNNPAVLISLYNTSSAKAPIIQQWALEGMLSHGRQQQKEWSFVLNKVRVRYSSGIKLSRDPGMPVVYVGFLFLVLGTFVSGFLTPLAVTLQGSLSPDGKGTVVRINGYSTKDAVGLRFEIEAMTRNLERILSTGV